MGLTAPCPSVAGQNLSFPHYGLIVILIIVVLKLDIPVGAIAKRFIF
jgi:hypothetical protein